MKNPVILVALLALAACSSFDRSDNAAAAKAHMVGMSREEILACMGIPKKKASEGATEVWSYLSTDGRGDSSGLARKLGGVTVSDGTHVRSFCTVNIVMKNGVVDAVHYNGPTSSNFFTQDDQCGYAVQNCVEK